MEKEGYGCGWGRVEGEKCLLFIAALACHDVGNFSFLPRRRSVEGRGRGGRDLVVSPVARDNWMPA